MRVRVPSSLRKNLISVEESYFECLWFYAFFDCSIKLYFNYNMPVRTILVESHAFQACSIVLSGFESHRGYFIKLFIL